MCSSEIPIRGIIDCYAYFFFPAVHSEGTNFSGSRLYLIALEDQIIQNLFNLSRIGQYTTRGLLDSDLQIFSLGFFLRVKPPVAL